MKKIKGFTLVEALVSLGLLVLMVIVLVGIFPAVRGGLQLSEDHLNAASIARSLMEDLRQDGFGGIVGGSGSRNLTGTKNGAPFSRTFNYTVNVQNLAEDKKLLWIVLNWQENGKSKQMVDETIVVK